MQRKGPWWREQPQRAGLARQLRSPQPTEARGMGARGRGAGASQARGAHPGEMVLGHTHTNDTSALVQMGGSPLRTLSEGDSKLREVCAAEALSPRTLSETRPRAEAALQHRDGDTNGRRSLVHTLSGHRAPC